MTGRGVVLALAASAVLSGACHPRYQPPALGEPQAMLKVRIAYHDTPGTRLDQLVLVNGHNPAIPTPVNVPGEISRAIPVRLEGTRIDVRSTFYHLVTTMQMRPQSYRCGAYATCTRMVMVPVTVRVTDAHCESAAGLGPQRDGVYLLQYDYYANGRCSLMCMRQWPQPDGTFRNGPCEPPPPPPK